ncbi:MAG: DedA family protein [Acetobacteraceae bacterium]
MIASVAGFIKDHEVWAAPLGFALAFGESLAFISLLLPATAILLGVGILIGASEISFLPIWLAAALGAGLGDWTSYWIGRRFGGAILGVWPLSRHAGVLPRAHAPFARWGMAGVFIGRFLGPLRAVVPLLAGISSMPQGRFQFANFTSAFLWAAAVLAPGNWGFRWIETMLA